MENGIVVRSMRADSRLEGDLVRGDKACALAADLLLPFDPMLATRSAVAGYFRRSWGVPGWNLVAGHGERCCPLVLDAVHNRDTIYWAAEVIRTKPDGGGQLRLAVDTARGPTIGTLMNPDDADGRIEHGLQTPQGWIVGGRSKLVLGQQGYLTLSLYAVARGVSVAWAAVTQSSDQGRVPWLPLKK